MNYKVLVLFFCLTFINSYSQVDADDYYQMYQGGDKFIKKSRFLLFNDENDRYSEKIYKKYFYILNEQFIHDPKRHEQKTYSSSEVDKIQFSNTRDLVVEEFKIFKKRSKEIYESINLELPPPLVHNIFKIFIVVKSENDDYYVYETMWRYGIY